MIVKMTFISDKRDLIDKSHSNRRFLMLMCQCEFETCAGLWSRNFLFDLTLSFTDIDSALTNWMYLKRTLNWFSDLMRIWVLFDKATIEPIPKNRLSMNLMLHWERLAYFSTIGDVYGSAVSWVTSGSAPCLYKVDPALGYIQGMSYPTAMLFAYFDQERAFWCFFKLMCGKRYHFLALRWPFCRA
jgi:hypothetical protein